MGDFGEKYAYISDLVFNAGKSKVKEKHKEYKEDFGKYYIDEINGPWVKLIEELYNDANNNPKFRYINMDMRWYDETGKPKERDPDEKSKNYTFFNLFLTLLSLKSYCMQYKLDEHKEQDVTPFHLHSDIDQSDSSNGDPKKVYIRKDKNKIDSKDHKNGIHFVICGNIAKKYFDKFRNDTTVSNIVKGDIHFEDFDDSYEISDA